MLAQPILQICMIIAVVLQKLKTSNVYNIEIHSI